MKILVRATNWVGDAVMSIPALGAIRGRWPRAEITILGRAWVADLYRGQGYADHLLVFDHAGRHRGLMGRVRLISELRRERFDVALLLQNAFEAAWLASRARIPVRIGYNRDARGFLLTRAVRTPRPGEIPAHESYYYLELLRRAGWIEQLGNLERIELRVDPAAHERAETILLRGGARRGARRVALAPGAAYGSAKCWPPERYAALADRAIADFDADVILFGTVAEREVAQRIAAAMRHRPITLVGETSIGDMPALLAGCHLFIGNDSGAMHVAAAVGLPVVGIFGPTDPAGTAPVTPRFTMVRQAVSCSPCFLRHCPVDHRCMTRIEVDAVYGAARPWLSASERGSARSV
jgi:heptosyltransferase-2